MRGRREWEWLDAHSKCKMPINHDHVQNMPMVDEHVKFLGFGLWAGWSGVVGRETRSKRNKKRRNIYPPFARGGNVNCIYSSSLR